MALDGIAYEGVTPLRIRRPNDYNPVAAALLGPSGPSPSLNLLAVGLGPGSQPAARSAAPAATTAGAGGSRSGLIDPRTTAAPEDAAERIFIGGLPYYLTEENCRELLGSFGTVKAFDLVRDRETGNSKGYGFAVYLDSAVTEVAIKGLHGLRMGDRTLTVRRAGEGVSGGGGGGGSAAGAAVPTAAMMGGIVGMTTLSAASRIVILSEAVTPEELTDDTEYEEIVEDMRDEGGKHGQLINVLIPRPTPEDPTPAGVGKVVLEYGDVNAAVRARNAMHGRRFANRTVVATYLTEEAYAGRQF